LYLFSALFDQVIQHYGVPRILLTDRGSEFTAALFNHLCKRMNLKHVTTTAYNPQCNGKNEKIHLFLQTAMFAFIDKKHKNWDRYLPAALLAYRTSPLAGIGYSPAYLCHGFEPNLPFDIIYGAKTLIKDDILRMGTRFSDEIRTAFDIVNKLRKQNNKKVKDRYDNPRTPKARYNPEFTEGSHVLLRIAMQTQGRSKKFLPRWGGPFTVQRRHTTQTWVIADKNGKEQTVNAKRLISYQPWTADTEQPHDIFQRRQFGFLPHQKLPVPTPPPTPKPKPKPTPQPSYSRTRRGRKRKHQPMLGSDGIIRGGFRIEIVDEAYAIDLT
jgi:hypothetical protein